MKWITTLFPYRTHLEEEVVYLKGQLAQKQRRIDELQEQLVGLLKPAPKTPRSVPPVPAIVAKGWDGYRASKRGEANDSSEVAQAGREAEPKEASPAVDGASV